MKSKLESCSLENLLNLLKTSCGILTLLVLKLENSVRSRSVQWLLMPWPHFYQTRSAWSVDQGSNKNHSPAYNFAPTVTKFCVMWEGLSLPHDTKFGNCWCKIVDSRAFPSWSLIHGLRWSGLIKAEPGDARSSHQLSWYWLCRCLASMKEDFNYLPHLSVEKWKCKWISFMFPKINSALQGLNLAPSSGFLCILSIHPITFHSIIFFAVSMAC